MPDLRLVAALALFVASPSAQAALRGPMARAFAGQVIDARGARWMVVAVVNDVDAARSTHPLDLLADRACRNGAMSPAGVRR